MLRAYPLSTDKTLRVILPLLAALPAAILAGILIPAHASDLVIFLVVAAVFIAVLRFPRLGLYLIMLLMPLQYLVLLDNEATAIRYLGWITFAAWGSQKLIRKDPLRPLLTGSLFQAIGAFLLLCFVSVLWSPFAAWRVSIFTYVQLASMVIILVDLIDSWKRLKMLLFLLYFGSMLGAGIVISEYLSLFPGWAFQRRPLGGFGDPNFSAASLMFILPYAFFLGTNHRGWKRIIGLVSIPILLTAVALTVSRTGLLLIAVWLVLQSQKLPKWRNRVLFLLGMACITIVIARFGPWAAIEERFSIAWTGGNPEDLGGRVRKLSYAFGMFIERPLIGYGLGYDLGNWRRFVAHNLFVEMAVRLGLLGLLAMSWILAVTWRSISAAYRNVSTYGHAEAVSLLYVIRNSMLIYLFFSLAASTETSRLLWFTFALGSIGYRLAGGVYPSRSPKSVFLEAKTQMAPISMR